VRYPEPTDLPDSLHIQPFNDKSKPYQEQTIVANEPQPAMTQEEFKAKGGGEDGVYLNTEGELAFYDCSRLNLEGNNYVMRESVQPDLVAAKRHIQYLRQSGIEANCVWMGCFSRANLSYVIFIDLIYENKKTILTKMTNEQARITNKGLSSKLSVISLTGS
jgi:hypothetical protein